MNPTNQPVSFYGDNSRNTDGALLAAMAAKDYYAPALDGATNSAIGCARDQIGDLKGIVKDAASNIRADVKDAEADIRSDVRQEGQDMLKTALEVEARLKDRLSIDKNAQDAQFLALNNRLCESEKEAIKIGYENRLETIREGDKTREKIAHLSERMGDKFESSNKEVADFRREFAVCCCEVKSALSLLTGGILPTHVHASK